MKLHQINHLKLFSSVVKKSNPVLIVGNAYGIMPYIEPLANSLVEQDFTPYWFAFSGQEGTAGKYSIKQGVEDLEAITEFIKNQHPTSEVNVLSHCAGSLLTLEYITRKLDHPVSKLIVYGLLFNMNRRRPIAERRLKRCGINYDLSEADWNYNPLSALSEIKIPTLFCHAKDKLNLERATPEEMTLAVAATRNSTIEWFDEGYDRDTNLVRSFISRYTDFLS